jgi:MFS family permease
MSPLIAYSLLAKTTLGWRAVYWYIFAFEGFSLILVVLFYHPPNFNTKHRRDGKTRWELVRQMDFIGFGLFSLGCILFLIGVNWGGRAYAWNSAPVISTIVIGAALLVVLGFYEAYAPLKYPMLPTKFFKNIRGFTVLLVVCFVGGMLYYSMNVLWPRESGKVTHELDRHAY